MLIVDGSTVNMPDTPANQRAYPEHSNQKRGCGFPIARFVVMLSLATGSVLDAAIGASKGKLTGEHALLRSLHGRLKPGDIVLADVYYSSVDEVMSLVQMGVDVVMRQTDRQPTDRLPSRQEARPRGPSDRLAPTPHPVEVDEPRGVCRAATRASDARNASPSGETRIPDQAL